jgi:hypothetical protein
MAWLGEDPGLSRNTPEIANTTTAAAMPITMAHFVLLGALS